MSTTVNLSLSLRVTCRLSTKTLPISGHLFIVNVSSQIVDQLPLRGFLSSLSVNLIHSPMTLEVIEPNAISLKLPLAITLIVCRLFSLDVYLPVHLPHSYSVPASLSPISSAPHLVLMTVTSLNVPLNLRGSHGVLCTLGRYTFSGFGSR